MSDQEGRSLGEFKQRHDPETIIKNLEADLRAARQESADAKAIKEAVGTISADLADAQPPEWALTEMDPGSPGVPTLFLSDLHWGEVVKASQVNGVNSFDLETANRRLRHTVETACQLLKIVAPYEDYPGIVVVLGGDMVSGNIHEELQATNELNTMPTVLDLYDALVGAIDLLAETFGQVFLPCVSGNHGRDTRKTWSKDRHHTSFDWLLYQFLAKHYMTRDDVNFLIPDGSDALFRIYNTTYNLTHGDQFRGGDSIIGPLGPLTRGNQKKLARQTAVGQEYDIMLAGHFHTYIHMARLIVNGSLKGYDEYAFQQNFGFEAPEQALWITHPRRGVTFRMPVQCEDVPSKGKEAPWVSHLAT